MNLSFVKYSGNGNDFVILDHPAIPMNADLVKKLCDRHFGVGADGVLVLGDHDGADARMQIFNADGEEAEMCANGMRCLVTYLNDKSSVKKGNYSIKTMNALYQVKTVNGTFALEMSEIKDKNIYDLSTFVDFEKSFYVNTGVPHLVFLGKQIKDLEIKKVGSFYRYHKLFPKGTNVSFAEVLNPAKQEAYVRTYERGVEDETHSCGTGLTAVALAFQHWLDWKGPIHLKTLGGNQLVNVDERVFYSGEVTFCFKGELEV